MKSTCIYILFLLAGTLHSVPAYTTEQTTERLLKLQKLINNNLLYTQEVTNDSLIEWEKALSHHLEKNKQYIPLFQLKQMAVCAYAIRGDISMAVDLARIMYNKAKSMNHPIGIALSSRAIGDAYFNADMPQEAVEAYESSLQLFKKQENTEMYSAQVLPKLIITLIQLKELEKAKTYLKQLNALFSKTPSESTHFFILTSYAAYYIQTGETSKAKILLSKAENKNKKLNEVYYQYIIDYTLATYYKTIGDYEQALSLFNNLRTDSFVEMFAGKLIQLYQVEASLLAQTGRIDEACCLYQQANAKKDSLNTICYIRQINDLRTTYQIDEIELQSQVEENQIIRWAILIVSIVLVLITVFILRIKIANRRLLRSQTQLEVAKKYAENSIRTKSLFISNMSHEIRTPLNALSGFSAILTDDSIDNETRQQCNEIIQQNSELLLKLINDVVDLSGLDVSKLTFHFQTYDAVNLCRNVIDTVRKIKQTQAEVNFVTSLDTLELFTDNSRLQQVLINLLINATKFTTEGTITLELTKESEEMARFTVTDTGCGIPPEKQSKIFNRFEKLNEEAQGTGLGLSICQLIIEQIGGEISIDPTYIQGARFVFTHPLHPVIKKEKTQ